MTDDRDKKSRTAGVVYVAFGRNYNHQAAFSAKSVRRLSDIPICVFTNIKMEPAWDGLDGVEVVTGRRRQGQQEDQDDAPQGLAIP